MSAVLVLLLASALQEAARPGPEDPLRLVEACVRAPDAAARAAAAERLAAHPDCRPSRLREWLHHGAAFGALPPGPLEMRVDVGAGETRRVSLVLPRGYRPDRAWPLVYALHPSGTDPGDWARAVERMFGRRADEHVIASPEYRQNYVAAKPPFVAEHPAILDAVFRRVHVDASRVHAFGYSRGGFGAWYVALYHPDRLAGAIALAAGFDVAPGDDGFWKLLVRNVAHVPVLNAWGEVDPLTIEDLTGKKVESFAASNRRFAREVRGMGLPITNLEVPGAAHHRLAPPGEALREVLAARRPSDPARVDHTFRHLHQASAYWLEGLSWVGPSWGDPPPPAEPRPGETAAAALARALEPLLGRLAGERDGQTLRVERRHVGDVVVWLGERAVDWDRPVRVELDGRVVFSGRLSPDPALAAARAAATMDFESLRFAGIRVGEGGEATVLTARTLPDPAWRTAR